MPKHAPHRSSPYLADDLAATVHRSAAGLAWRWRYELITLLLLSAALLRLRLVLGGWLPAGITTTVVVLAVIAIPGTRRVVARRFWCVLIRHRIHRLCWEARLHTRSGRLPLVVWTRPTKVGERAWVLVRAGICAEDFEDRTGQLRAACYARDARITRNPRWSQLIRIDIIRRDTLAATQQIPSPLLTYRPALRPAGGEVPAPAPWPRKAAESATELAVTRQP